MAKTKYMCEVCNRTYDKLKEATDCEHTHTDLCDLTMEQIIVHGSPFPKAIWVSTCKDDSLLGMYYLYRTKSK